MNNIIQQIATHQETTAPFYNNFFSETSGHLVKPPGKILYDKKPKNIYCHSVNEDWLRDKPDGNEHL